MSKRTGKNLGCEERRKPYNYLELAKMDYTMVKANIDKLGDTAPAVTVSIAQAFEKSLCHLLMLRCAQFTPSHKCDALLNEVKPLYADFPEDINHVVCTLCTVWYRTNRYPQAGARGYENYHLILSMVYSLESLLAYCEVKDKELSDSKRSYTPYQLTEPLDVAKTSGYAIDKAKSPLIRNARGI